ncbi:MAG: riboflavin synthase [Ferruginibacter sp.]
MFTGIIEQTGTVKAIKTTGTNKTFVIESDLAPALKIDQSVAHNGVCLTVEAVDTNTHTITAISETLSKTNLNHWKEGTVINLERCMQMNGRIDGHIVQGHVDTVAQCTEIVEKAGSWEYRFEFDPQFAPLIIEKGSASINGISLTIFNIAQNGFTVAIIPYTYTHTNMQYLQVNDWVNIEFDMVGKYVTRFLALK